MQKQFLIIPNLDKQNCLSLVGEAAKFLHENSCRATCFEELSGSLSPFGVSSVGIEDLKNVDFCLVFGGDGTILNAAKRIGKYKIPLLGINMGHLGYLAEVDPFEMKEALSKIIRGEYFVENRTALQVKLDGRKKFIGFNEAVIHRGTMSRILPIQVGINGQPLLSLRADGVLTATPTGSTAYNLSAGGPILAPGSDSIVMTPICAHSLSARSIVVGYKDIITIGLSSLRDDCEALLTIDGEVKANLHSDSCVEIRNSKITIPLIKTNENSFYSTLKQKLGK